MNTTQVENANCLPCHYGENSIMLLPKDPYSLFVFWEISDERKGAFVSHFGKELWDKSHYALKVSNITKNNSFFININDSSNSWYISVSEPNCLYIAELGRKVSEEFFINLLSSNYAATPSNYVSTNLNYYFADYNEVRKGRFKQESRKIYDIYKYEYYSENTFGNSSLGIFEAEKESSFGTSSFEFFNFSRK